MEFSVAVEKGDSSAKKKKFRWRENHDIWLLTEVISIEPYKWKQGSKERGEAFTKIAKNLVQIPNSGFPDSLSQRAVRTRYFELLDAFKKQELKEMRATGIDADFDEKTQLLTDINCRMVEYEKGFLLENINKREKEEKEKATAEDMRKKASEKLSETTERNEGVNSKKRKASELVEYLKLKQEVNKANTEKEFSLREEELRLEKQRLENQRELQQQMAEQLKLQQQCQQAMFTFLQGMSMEKHK